MGGEAIAQWLNHNGTVSLGYQWPGDLSIAERATKEPGNQNDGLTGPHRRSAEGLTIGDFYVSHHRAIDREREESQAKQEHGGLDKALGNGEPRRAFLSGRMPGGLQRARSRTHG